jgi:hypothetical protein
MMLQLACEDPALKEQLHSDVADRWWELVSGTDSDYAYLETKESWEEGAIWFKAYLPREEPGSNMNAGTWKIVGEHQIRLDLTDEVQEALGVPLKSGAIVLTPEADGCFSVTVEICSCDLGTACPYEGPWMHP